jgi:heat shock protein HslJ
MRVGVEQFSMRQTRSASGVRYEAAGDPATVLHTKGSNALVSVRGEALAECTMASEPAQPFRATGNEPPWLATIDGDKLTLVTEYGAQTRSMALLDTQQSGTVTRYRASDGELALVMTASSGVCHDSMSGMPHPYSVDLASAQGVLRGCGGNPMDLLAGKEWEVTRLNDAVPLSDSRITLLFLPEDGRVAGGASCNRYNAAFELTGESLSFSRAASTMMACPEPLMTQEREFHSVLSGINAFDIDGAGMLELIGSEDRLFARPLPIGD